MIRGVCVCSREAKRVCGVCDMHEMALLLKCLLWAIVQADWYADVSSRREDLDRNVESMCWTSVFTKVTPLEER